MVPYYMEGPSWAREIHTNTFHELHDEMCSVVYLAVNT